MNRREVVLLLKSRKARLGQTLNGSFDEAE